MFKKFLNVYGVKLWLISKYHPQANACEAANKTIGVSIRAYIDGDSGHKDWDRHVTEIACAMNSAVHTWTKHSPYNVNFGYDMVTFFKTYEQCDDNVESAADKNKWLADMRNLVKENLAKTHETSKRRYDLRSRPITYDPGEVVWRRNFALSNASKNFMSKLAPKFVKCRIKKKMGTSSYELVDMDGKDLGTFSSQHIKKNWDWIGIGGCDRLLSLTVDLASENLYQDIHTNSISFNYHQPLTFFISHYFFIVYFLFLRFIFTFIQLFFRCFIFFSRYCSFLFEIFKNLFSSSIIFARQRYAVV